MVFDFQGIYILYHFAFLCIQSLIPIGSMGLVYLPTCTININLFVCKYTIHGSLGIVMFPTCFFGTFFGGVTYTSKTLRQDVKKLKQFPSTFAGRNLTSFTGKGKSTLGSPKPFNMYSVSESQRIHVWYIYLHSFDLYGKRR